jgi:hypothetical protein
MTDATITALRTFPSPVPAGEGEPHKDVTAPLRARRYRPKRKASSPARSDAEKSNEIKSNVTPGASGRLRDDGRGDYARDLRSRAWFTR